MGISPISAGLLWTTEMIRKKSQRIYQNEEDRRIALIRFIIISLLAAYVGVVSTALYLRVGSLLLFSLAGCAFLVVPPVMLFRGQLRASELVLSVCHCQPVHVCRNRQVEGESEIEG